MQTVFLNPSQNSKYHFGDFGLESSSLIFHSDSLFSAIVNNYLKLYGESELNKDIKEIKKIKLSSVFPAVEIDNEKIYFIPKPKIKLNFRERDKEKIEEKPKDIKKIQFISLGVLGNHNKNEVEFSKDLIIDGKFLITREESEKIGKIEKIFVKGLEEKVWVSRGYKTGNEKREEGEPYTVEFIKPMKKLVFYFVYDDKNVEETIKKKIRASIQLMVDEGLGGKLTSGAGHFEKLEFSNCNLFDNPEGNGYLNISLVIPNNAEEFDKCKFYTLLERKGYVFSEKTKTQRKKSIVMVEEGSIFSQNIEGKIADVKPDDYNHPVYKFGCFYGISIKVNDNE